jgi:hypothetical protein
MPHKCCTFILLSVLMLNAGLTCVAQTLNGGVTQTDQAAEQERLRIARPPINGSTEQTDLNASTSESPSGWIEDQPKIAPQRPDSRRSLIGSLNDFSAPKSKLIEQQVKTTEFDEHGHRIVGVIGCEVNNFTGTLLAVFPPSNLNQWGIHRGDRVLGYNNHRWRNGWDMVKEGCMGPPGSIIEITVLHDGQVMSLQVPRVDSRLLVGYDRFVGAHHYEECAAQTRFW